MHKIARAAKTLTGAAALAAGVCAVVAFSIAYGFAGDGFLHSLQFAFNSFGFWFFGMLIVSVGARSIEYALLPKAPQDRAKYVIGHYTYTREELKGAGWTDSQIDDLERAPE